MCKRAGSLVAIIRDHLTRQRQGANDMTQRNVLLQALASTPADVTRLTRGLDKTAAVWSPDGGWSCRDVAAHLAHVEPLHLARLRRVVAEQSPTLDTILPDLATQPELSITQLTACFVEARGVMLAWLHEISPGDWQRLAFHPTLGRTNLRALVDDLVAHDIEYTSQLVMILGQWRTTQRRLAIAPEHSE